MQTESFSGRLLWKVVDVEAWMAMAAVVNETAETIVMPPRRRGRPAKAEQRAHRARATGKSR